MNKQLICSDIIRLIKLYFYDNLYDPALIGSNLPKMIPFKVVLDIIAKYGDFYDTNS